MSLHNLVTDNFKEYDFNTEYCLNIYITPLLCFFQLKILNIDKYFVYESRDMSDESGTYIILLKLKTILFTWR
jgi:hypothetical protein